MLDSLFLAGCGAYGNHLSIQKLKIMGFPGIFEFIYFTEQRISLQNSTDPVLFFGEPVQIHIECPLVPDNTIDVVVIAFVSYPFVRVGRAYLNFPASYQIFVLDPYLVSFGCCGVKGPVIHIHLVKIG